MFKDFHKAWNYLNNHKKFEDNNTHLNHFQECLDIDVVKVNPKTNSIDEINSKNTKTNIWLECGEYNSNQKNHNINLDCGAETFEKAIVKLANLVKLEYD